MTRLKTLASRSFFLPVFVGAIFGTGCSMSGSGAESFEEQTEADSSDQILNGSASPKSDNAVVFVERGCTGTLIAPNLVLTAAHCVLGEMVNSFWCGNYPPGTVVDRRTLREDELRTPYAVRFGKEANNPEAIQGSTRVAQVIVPQMNVTSLGADLCEHDLALLVLQSSATYYDGSAVPVMPISFDKPARRQNLRVVGYGTAADSDGDTIRVHPRLQASAPFLSLAGSYPTASSWPRHPLGNEANDYGRTDIASARALALWGDSGGPVIRRVGSVDHLLAVVSRASYEGTESMRALPWQRALRAERPVTTVAQMPLEDGNSMPVGVNGMAATTLAPHREWLNEGLRLAQRRLSEPTSAPACRVIDLSFPSLQAASCSSALRACFESARSIEEKSQCYEQYDPDETCSACISTAVAQCAVQEGVPGSCAGFLNCREACVEDAGAGCTTVKCVQGLLEEGGACATEQSAYDECVTEANRTRCRALELEGCW